MKRLIIILPSLLALMAVIVVIGGVVVPTYHSIRSTHAAIATEYEFLERRYQQSRVRSRAARELTELEHSLAELTNRVPKESETLVVIRKIETIAAAHRLEERIAIAGSAARIGDRFSDVPTVIELSGPYPDLIAALRDLERMPLPPVIERLDFSSTASLGLTPASRPRLRLILQSNMLWQREV